MEHNPIKKKMQESSGEWKSRKDYIKKREIKQRRVKAEKDGGKRG